MITIFNGRKRTLGGETSEVWAQIDVAFRDHIAMFRGAKLGVFLAIALHSDADGWAWPSYALLSKETGYGLDTIRRALADLCAMTVNDHRVLLRYQPQAKDGQYTSNRYLLFPSPQEVIEYAGAGVRHLAAETGGGFDDRPWLEKPTTVDRGGKIPLRQKPSTEKPTTNKNHIEQEPMVVGVGSELGKSQLAVLDDLTGLGVDPGTARKLAKTCEPEQVAGWVEYARGAKGLDNAAGLVVARLRAGEPAPVAPPVGDREKADDWRRFVIGEFAEYIEG